MPASHLVLSNLLVTALFFTHTHGCTKEDTTRCKQSTFSCPRDGSTDIVAINGLVMMTAHSCCAFMFHECCVHQCEHGELITGFYFESNGNASCYYDTECATPTRPANSSQCSGLAQAECLSLTAYAHPVCAWDAEVNGCFSIEIDGTLPSAAELLAADEEESAQAQSAILMVSAGGGAMIGFVGISALFVCFCFVRAQRRRVQTHEMMMGVEVEVGVIENEECVMGVEEDTTLDMLEEDEEDERDGGATHTIR